MAVSGGAPLSPSVARFFIGLGLPLTQGYGLTEAAPVVSGSEPDDCIPESAGPALPGIEVRLSPSGELLVRAPSLMLGYWRRPHASREAIDDQGWLHTGDLAEISDGAIRIRGRLKEMVATSSGEKVPPADMEMALTLDPLFDQALVLGEGRPYLAALLVINPETWRALAPGLGLDADDPAPWRVGRHCSRLRRGSRSDWKGSRAMPRCGASTSPWRPGRWRTGSSRPPSRSSASAWSPVSTR